MSPKRAPSPKWGLQDAVRDSRGLSPECRLLMFVFSNEADTKTLRIKAEHSPSLTTLARWTALGRSTVAEKLNELEELGWLERNRPSVAAARSEGATTAYRLMIGRDPEPKPKAKRATRRKASSPEAGLPVVQDMDHPTGSPGHGLVQGVDHGSPGAGPAVVQELDAGSPPPGHKPDLPDLTREVLPDTPADAVAPGGTDGALFDAPKTPPAPPKPETAGQRRYRLAATYTARVAMSNKDAVAGVVGKAIAAGYDDDTIERGLTTLADERRSVTTDSLRIAIEGRPQQQSITTARVNGWLAQGRAAEAAPTPGPFAIGGAA